MATLNKPKPCKCGAYPFPHRLDSGKCRDLYNETDTEEQPVVSYTNDYYKRMNEYALKESDFIWISTID